MCCQDPTGLLSYCERHRIVPQAYSPLGNYATHSLLRANITAEIGRANGALSPATLNISGELRESSGNLGPVSLP